MLTHHSIHSFWASCSKTYSINDSNYRCQNNMKKYLGTFFPVITAAETDLLSWASFSCLCWTVTCPWWCLPVGHRVPSASDWVAVSRTPRVIPAYNKSPKMSPRNHRLHCLPTNQVRKQSPEWGQRKECTK